MATYPALVVPVEGKYGFSCPDDHVQFLKGYLAECKNVLFIGHSAKDFDLLKLLGEYLLMPELFCLVGKDSEDEESEESVAGVNSRILARIPQLGGTEFRAYDGGFTDFLENEGAEEFGRLSKA